MREPANKCIYKLECIQQQWPQLVKLPGCCNCERFVSATGFYGLPVVATPGCVATGCSPVLQQGAARCCNRVRAKLQYSVFHVNNTSKCCLPKPSLLHFGFHHKRCECGRFFFVASFHSHFLFGCVDGMWAWVCASVQVVILILRHEVPTHGFVSFIKVAQAHLLLPRSSCLTNVKETRQDLVLFQYVFD